MLRIRALHAHRCHLSLDGADCLLHSASYPIVYLIYPAGELQLRQMDLIYIVKSEVQCDGRVALCDWLTQPPFGINTEGRLFAALEADGGNMRTKGIGALALVLVFSLGMAACGGGGGGGGGDDPGFVVTPIEQLPASINAALSSQDIVAPDGTYFDLYEVAVPASGTLTIRMTSDAIDSYLWLFNPDCLNEPNIDNWEQYYIADNDDFGLGSDAEIQIGIAAGKYIIAANSFDIEEGPYTLNVTFASTPARVAPPDNEKGQKAWFPY